MYGQRKLNRHITSQAVLMLFTKNCQKFIRACQNYCMQNLAQFFATQGSSAGHSNSKLCSQSNDSTILNLAKPSQTSEMV